MKLNKLIAALSVVSMLGSMAVVPTMAEETSGYSITKTASVSATLRGDGGWSTQNKRTNAFKTGDEKVEITGNNYIGGLFIFDPIELPEHATLSSVTLTLENARQAAVPYRILDTNVPELSTTLNQDDLSAAFKVISSSMESNTTVSSIYNKGDSTYGYVTADVTSIYDPEEKNAYFAYMPAESGVKYEVYADATLTVAYTMPNVINTTTKNSYTTLKDANDASSDGDTLAVYNDIDASTSRITVGKNLTISSGTDNRKTVTVKNNESTGGILLNIANHTLTISNINIFTSNNGNAVAVEGPSSGSSISTLNISDAKITGNVQYLKHGTKGTISNTIITNNLILGDTAEPIIILNNTSIGGIFDIKPENADITMDSDTTIGTLSVANPSEGLVVIKGSGLSETQVLALSEELTNAGYRLIATDAGLALTTEAEEPEEPKKYNTDYFQFNFSEVDFGESESRTFTTVKISGTAPESQTFTGTKSGTNITVNKNSNVSLYVNITGVPEGYTVEKMTLE